jgi:hypothetical protein
MHHNHLLIFKLYKSNKILKRICREALLFSTKEFLKFKKNLLNQKKQKAKKLNQN